MSSDLIEVVGSTTVVEAAGGVPATVEVVASPVEVVTVDRVETVVEVTAVPSVVVEVSGQPLVTGLGTAALVSHVNSLTPHPTYDDLPSLALIFENGII